MYETHSRRIIQIIYNGVGPLTSEKCKRLESKNKELTKNIEKYRNIPEEELKKIEWKFEKEIEHIERSVKLVTDKKLRVECNKESIILHNTGHR